MILSDVWCCYDCVTESDQCAAAARRCIQLLLPGTQGCFTETLRLQLELWNFRYLLIYINAVLILSLRRSWAFSEDLSIIGSFPTVHGSQRYIQLSHWSRASQWKYLKYFHSVAPPAFFCHKEPEKGNVTQGRALKGESSKELSMQKSNFDHQE